MGFIDSLFDKYKQNKQEKEDACNALLVRVETAIADINSRLVDKFNFINPQQVDIWNECHRVLFEETSPQNIQGLKRTSQYGTLLQRRNTLVDMHRLLPQIVPLHNNEVANSRIDRAYSLVGYVEGRVLDRQQMICIVKEARNHLVIAGAGTGKTTTIIGKIKYLLNSRVCRPEDILVLSFTNASATEMCQRIHSETGENIEASTFHKLGMNIIAAVDGVKPKITQLSLRRFIKAQLQNLMKSADYICLLNTYLLFHRVMAKSEFDFQTEQEYREYLSMNPPTTLRNETVKSYGEMDIANYLVQNGINYIYEHPYVIDTRTEEFEQYLPDFYLPDYDIYIEYFGIDREGKVPPYFRSENGVSASERYQASMAWKRQLHRDNNTVLLECFAYEKFEGTLLEELEKKLKDANVEMNPKSAEELWAQVSSKNESVLDGIIELFETLINLLKSNGFNIVSLRERNKAIAHSQSNDILISLLEPIYKAYCEYLAQHEEIDFNDMINKAAFYVQHGRFRHAYRYVIVDEYQDISKARFHLLNCLRQSRDFDLFCVGDDWQSIYRFAGSDIGYILNFSRYWGATEISRIETTYRFSQTLIEITGGFVMNNPFQIKKSIRGKNDEAGFPLGEICGYTEKNAIAFMVEKINELPKNSSVFFIGRYSFDEKLLGECGMLECRYNNSENIREIIYLKRPDLKMEFITAHKSKGLQADYVFIINNKRSRMGFPSKIQDSPILDILLDNYEQFPCAEERRLFYVALTRAKKKVYIVTVEGEESEFAMELKYHYGDRMKSERFTCPECGGRLLRRTGPYGSFYGCSNFSTTGCKFKRKIVSEDE